MATVLTIIQNAAAEIGVPVGTSIASTDKTMVRMKALLNRTGKNLRRQAPWPECLRRWVIVTTDTRTLYELPADWDSWANETFWNNDDARRIYGPLTPAQYEYLQNGVVSTAEDNYYSMKGMVKRIEITPAPDATGQYLYYEYFSTNWLRPAGVFAVSTVYDANVYVCGRTSAYSPNDYIFKTRNAGTSGTTYPSPKYDNLSTDPNLSGTVYFDLTTYEEVLADTDIVLLDEELMTLGLMYRFLDGKGLQSAKIETEYLRVLKERLGQVVGGRTLYLSPDSGPYFATKEFNMPVHIEV